MTTNHSKNQSLVAGSCLISELATRLLELDAATLPDTCVTVPTQRLKLYLIRELLLRQGGACVLPRITTWDTLIEGQRTTEINTSVMVSGQIELLLEKVITNVTSSETKRFHVNSAHAHELAQFYAELIRSGVRDHGQADLKATLEGQWYRSQAALEIMNERIDDVFAVLQDFESTMESHHWATKPLERTRAVEELLSSLHSTDEVTLKNLFACDRLIITGLTSLPKTEQDLLQKLARLDGVEVWLDEPPPELKSAPLISLRQKVGLGAHTTDASLWAKNVKSITSCADVTHEVLNALQFAFELMNHGCEPHEIAIIVPDEKVHGPAFAASKDFFEKKASELLKKTISINLPLAASWETSMVGSWLRLLRQACEISDVGAIGQYLMHPVTRNFFAAGSFDFNALQSHLKDFPTKIDKNLSQLEIFLKDKISKEFLQYVLQAYAWCTSKGDWSVNSIKTMTEKLHSVCAAPQLGRFKREPRDEESWRILSAAIGQASQLDGVLDYRLNHWPKFLDDIYRLCKSESLRDTGEPLCGLQILGLTEARYVPLKHAIIVGCVEGSFPHALPVDSLIDNTLRQAIGLPGWNDLEALEDTTFHLLTARIPNVHLTYSASDGDSPQIRSRWIERLAVKIKIHEANLKKSESWLGCTDYKLEAIKTPSVPTQKEGLVSDLKELLGKASASRLKNLLWCPYRYLMDARGVSEVELPEDRLQLKIGQMLHLILERFFDGNEFSEMPRDLALQHCPTDSNSFVDWATRRLEVLANCIIPRDLRRREEFQQMLAKGWHDVAVFWGQLLEAGFSPTAVATELTIGKESSAFLDMAGRKISVRGSIDALHNSSHGSILVDYKTSTVPVKKEISVGLEPQLPLYAQTVSSGTVDRPQPLKPDLSHLGAVYFNLRDGKPTFAAVGSNLKPVLQASRLLSKNSRTDHLEDVVEAMKNRWMDRINAIEQTNRFEADPSKCEYCPYDGICRKDDPRFRETIEGQMKAGGDV